MTTEAHYDVVVVGAGSMGMSAGYHLAARGVRTLLLDKFDPPHREGSHHGEPRLIRHAYSGGLAYIRLALRADELWRELEERTGESLLYRSGVLNIADSELYAYEERMAEAGRAGIPVERLDAEEIRRRWPGWTLPDGYEAMYEPRAGYLRSERCVAAYRQAAVEEGAVVVAGASVFRIDAVSGGGVTVHSTKGVFRADQAILSAGAWFETLEPFIRLPIRAVRKTVGWFRPANAQFDEGRFPGFTLGTPQGGYYGFPSIGGAGVKIGRHDGGTDWSAAEGKPPSPFGSLPEDEGDLRGALETYLPDAAGQLVRGAACKYELTPDDQFIIDRHPAHRNVWIAGGFSGHGFKFASAVGETLADLAQRGAARHDISPFAIARFDETNAYAER